MTQPWNAKQLTDQTGKIAVVTGASNGIGYEAALELAGKGAEVVLAVRNVQRGEAAAEKICSVYPQAKVRVMLLDLSDLDSIKRFTEAYRQNYSSLFILLNNAGVMIPPYQKTKDGFELQFGTNHLGHFALTGLLLPTLLSTPHSRVVTVASMAATRGKIDFDNLDGSKGYQRIAFYSQSKLANLLFAKELQNRLTVAGAKTISIACHPGFAHTNLMSMGSEKKVGMFFNLVNSLFAQPAEMGALPSLYAATHPLLQGGEYIGPDGKGGQKGYPTLDHNDRRLYDDATAKRLWAVSEELTGVSYSF